MLPAQTNTRTRTHTHFPRKDLTGKRPSEETNRTFKAVDDVLSYAASVEGWLLAHYRDVPVQPVVVVLVHRKTVQHHLAQQRRGKNADDVNSTPLRDRKNKQKNTHKTPKHMRGVCTI